MVLKSYFEIHIDRNYVEKMIIKEKKKIGKLLSRLTHVLCVRPLGRIIPKTKNIIRFYD